MNEKVVSLTCKNVAELLFKDKDHFPKLGFYLTKDDRDDYSGGCEIAVIGFADSHLVIGNYAGGGSPFCYDFTDDTDESGLHETMLSWLKEISCDEVDGECILHVDEIKNEGKTLPEVIIVVRGGIVSVYSTLCKLGVEVIDMDVTDPDDIEEADSAISEIEEGVNNGKYYCHW